MKKLLNDISCVYLPVVEIEKSLKWFVRIFDVEKSSDAIDSIEFFDGPRLRLIHTNRLARTSFNRNNELNQVFGFRTTRIYDLHKKLSIERIYVSPILNEGHGSFIYFFDLDGNYFMVHQLPNVTANSRDPLIEGIRYLELPTPNLQQAVQWYQNLGFEFAGMGNPELAFLDISAGAHLLIWQTNDKVHLYEGEEEHQILDFQTSCIDDLLKHLQELNMSSTVIEEKNGLKRVVYINDPNGHMYRIEEIIA